MPSFEMPVLSFLPKPYRSRWKGKSAVKSPFAGRGLHSHSASSLHPYAAPDVIDINYNHSQEHAEPEDPTEVAASSSTISAIPSESPQVKLDIDITPEPLTDWFSTNFPQPESEPFTVSFPGDPGPSRDPQALRSYRLNAASRSGSVGEDTNDGDDYPGTSSEDVIRGLQAIGPSDFISDSILDRSILSEDIWDKKQPPNPIRIPNGLSYSPLYYARRSEDFASRPQSQLSSPPSSAISGTTFARALLGNTFVLSSDGRSSRYRSGSSGLVRSDSATLPRGEHPLSPTERERKHSGGAESLTPGSGDIPPIPAGAELLYVPPQTPRHSGVDAREKRKRRSSTGSLLVRPESLSNIVPSTPIRRRISKISEVTSAPQTPEISQQGAQASAEHARHSPTTSPRPLPSVFRHHQDNDSPILPPDSHFTPKNSRSTVLEPLAASQEPVAVEIAQDRNINETEPLPVVPPSLPAIADSPILASPIVSTTNQSIPEFPTSPDSNSSYPTSPEPIYASSEQSPASDKAPSPKDIRDVLDYYSFANASEAPVDRGFKPAFSPISEESSSQLSPPAPYNRRQSLRSPLGARSRSPISASFGGMTIVQKNSDPRPQTKSGRLPIGDRPSSIQPPRTVFCHLSTKVFNRQRSGSAPSPIKVVRDSKDFNAYNITVSPLTDASSSTAPSTGNADDVVDQTFPETPSAFSPMLSPNSVSSTVSRGPSLLVIAPPMPSTPLSAALPSGNIRPSLDQQILLTRAATSVHGARTHSRQMSTGGRIQRTGSSSASVPAVARRAGPAPPESVSTPKPHVDVISSVPSPSGFSPAPVKAPEIFTHHVEDHSHSALSTDPAPLYSPAEPLNVRNRPISIHQVSDSSSVASSISRTSSLIKPLPLVSSSSNPEQRARAANPTPSSPAFNRDMAAPHSAQVAVFVPPPPTTEASLSSHSQLHPTPSSTSEEFGVLGSPPPYYQSSNTIDHGNSTRPVAPPITPTTSRSDQTSLGREGPSGNRRPRTRPPQARPAGPRQPSHSSPGISGRERNASVSSVISNPVARAPSRRQPAAFSPKFQPPSAKWRGYTMEAAKWTFTSSQLQNIVSRAIRQSAEASSIRLLRLEIIDNELPRELERLQAKPFVRNIGYSTWWNGGRNRQVFIPWIVDEMKDIATTLDMLAEDLHSISEQIAQLEKLKQQVAENEVQRKQMDSLVAERNEAWKQAEEVASDFDRYLNDRLEGSSSEQAKRSSRISASRKSSIRVSKAGLRSISRRCEDVIVFDDAPPVPPIPRRRPVDIRTDLPSRSPAGLSTDMVTPTSEMKALAEVQEELYRMLGLSVPDTRLRRSRSVLGLSSPPISAAMASSPFGGSTSHDALGISRRLSMPGSSTFAEAHSAMMADRDAMLATLNMLSEDD
ncbi:hypothetical protein BDQ17DRAFT_1420247 [Cyathus striatus]|nr:hypothetical protein BDQ17DRAFT_1420247 [Cyathus striatus]